MLKYAVIYESENGNTRQIAEEIYNSISDFDKGIFDLDLEPELPEAEVYLVGFGIHNGTCSMDVINCFEQITSGQFALFVTCGYPTTERYTESLQRHLEAWMPEDAEFLGMFLCQGRFPEEQQGVLLTTMPDQADALHQIFESGDAHPDAQDLQRAAAFAREIQRKTEA